MVCSTPSRERAFAPESAARRANQLYRYTRPEPRLGDDVFRSFAGYHRRAASPPNARYKGITDGTWYAGGLSDAASRTRVLGRLIGMGRPGPDSGTGGWRRSPRSWVSPLVDQVIAAPTRLLGCGALYRTKMSPPALLIWGEGGARPIVERRTITHCTIYASSHQRDVLRVNRSVHAFIGSWQTRTVAGGA